MCGEMCWRFRGNVFGDLEKTYSAIFGEKMCQRFGEIVRRFWRKPFGDNFGDLEKTYLAKSWSVIFVLEIGMEYCSARRPYVEIKTQWRKMETGYGDQNFIHHKVESTYLERFKDRNV